jgi:hemolysin activation/secretion protein
LYCSSIFQILPGYQIALLPSLFSFFNFPRSKTIKMAKKQDKKQNKQEQKQEQKQAQAKPAPAKETPAPAPAGKEAKGKKGGKK